MIIFDISNEKFKRILDDKELFLPLYWNGEDFSVTLSNHLSRYYESVVRELPRENTKEIKRINALLVRAIDKYLFGFPEKALKTFGEAMGILMQHPLKVYQKSAHELFERYGQNEDVKLYRVVRVNDIKPYPRERVFHTPYNLRSKVATCRYSIAGHPSLYLGTSLELCCKEIHFNDRNEYALASMFVLERDPYVSGTNIRVIELGIKPQDFIQRNNEIEDIRYSRPKSLGRLLRNIDVEFMSSYLLWYPLIAACSYVRTYREDPFAAEYIIPQLLMQWVRGEMENPRYSRNSLSDNNESELIGIRYFSCASQMASEMGFNYVFPTSGHRLSDGRNYCPILAKSFLMTKPVFINDYEGVDFCERSIEGSERLSELANI